MVKPRILAMASSSSREAAAGGSGEAEFPERVRLPPPRHQAAPLYRDFEKMHGFEKSWFKK